MTTEIHNKEIPNTEIPNKEIPNKETPNTEIPNTEIPWILIESYFKCKHLKQLVKHQLESYNYFVNNQIQQTIEMFNPLIIASEHDFIKELNLYRL